MISPQTCVTPLQELLLSKSGRSNMANSSAHCDYRSLFPHWGSSPWPPTQGQIKGKFKFPALWADPSYLQLYRKKKITLCSPGEDVYIESLTLSLKRPRGATEPLTFARWPPSMLLYLAVACSGGARERWLRGESQTPIQHQIPDRCVWTWWLIRSTWLEITFANHTNW